MKLIQPKDNCGQRLSEVVNADHFLTFEMEEVLLPEINDFSPRIDSKRPGYAICGYTIDEGRIELARYCFEELPIMEKDYSVLIEWLVNNNTGTIFNRWIS